MDLNSIVGDLNRETGSVPGRLGKEQSRDFSVRSLESDGEGTDCGSPASASSGPKVRPTTPTFPSHGPGTGTLRASTKHRPPLRLTNSVRDGPRDP